MRSAALVIATLGGPEPGRRRRVQDRFRLGGEIVGGDLLTVDARRAATASGSPCTRCSRATLHCTVDVRRYAWEHGHWLLPTSMVVVVVLLAVIAALIVMMR